MNNKIKDISIISILFGGIFLIWLIGWLLLNLSIIKEDRGQFGDQFGAINSLFSGLAFAGIAYTIWLQRQEIESEKRHIQKNETDHNIDRIESTFFRLLQIHVDILNVQYGTATGHQILYNMLNRMRQFYGDKRAEMKAASSEKQENMSDSIFASTFTTTQYAKSFFDRYANSLTSLLKYIHHSKIEQDNSPRSKKYLANIIKGQISEEEQILIIYYCLTATDKTALSYLINYYDIIPEMQRHSLLSEFDWFRYAKWRKDSITAVPTSINE